MGNLSDASDQELNRLADYWYSAYGKALKDELKEGELGYELRLYLQKWMSKEDLDAIVAIFEMNTAVLEDTLFGEDGPLSFLQTMNQRLLASLDVGGYDGIATASEKFALMMQVYVENTGEAIQDSGARLSKYMADIPGYIYDVCFDRTFRQYTLSSGMIG